MALTGRLVTSLSGKFTSLSLKTTFVGSSKATIFTDQSLAATSTQLPKRPLNPFLLFTQNQMANLRPQVGANAKVSEITKLAAEKYRVLPMAEKNALTESYKKSMVEYKAEMEKIKSTPEGQALLLEKSKDSVDKKIRGLKSKITKIKNETNYPKKPGTPMTAFMKVNYDQFSGSKASEKFKDGVAAWKNLSESEKSKYMSMTESSKAAFPNDLANWENKNGIKSEEINAMKQKITDLRNKLKPKPVKKAKAKKAAPKKVKKTTAKKSKAKPKAKAKAKAKN